MPSSTPAIERSNKFRAAISHEALKLPPPGTGSGPRHPAFTQAVLTHLPGFGTLAFAGQAKLLRNFASLPGPVREAMPRILRLDLSWCLAIQHGHAENPWVGAIPGHEVLRALLDIRQRIPACKAEDDAKLERMHHAMGESVEAMFGDPDFLALREKTLASEDGVTVEAHRAREAAAGHPHAVREQNTAAALGISVEDLRKRQRHARHMEGKLNVVK